ncbi:MAG: hypothetical protein ACXWDN_08675 [Limisphaerales bacterium]
MTADIEKEHHSHMNTNLDEHWIEDQFRSHIMPHCNFDRTTEALEAVERVVATLCNTNAPKKGFEILRGKLKVLLATTELTNEQVAKDGTQPKAKHPISATTKCIEYLDTMIKEMK